MPGTLHRPLVSLVPLERAGGLKAESTSTDPTGISIRGEECLTPRRSAAPLQVGSWLMLTLSPDIRLKHTLKLARPCFADHSSEGEALVAL